ncbi:MAG: asparagine synthetase A [delta proteobacterium ML8_F1]|nr:MAG: asparagine synthetase A [delta proteobacterium ML8_F1]
MSHTTIPKGYQPKLNLIETEIAIKKLKEHFQDALSQELRLLRVSAPMFVEAATGLNDNLNGFETPVSFEFDSKRIEIVHSLAKWKRMALFRYGIGPGEGLYTDMNAIRKDESLDNIHSIYVDQWDWEKVIDKSDRTEAKLREIVHRIYKVFKSTEDYIVGEYPVLSRNLPEEIAFVTTRELEARFPGMTPKEREDRIAKEKKAVFIMKIGGALASGEPHDGRAPDYDDWELNGDIIFYNPVLGKALELSSMGIRVDEETLVKQLEIAGATDRREMAFHRMLLQKKLPYTIGGGIGQSRICMYFLQKAHIGEVQASFWDEKTLRICEQAGVKLL